MASGPTWERRSLNSLTTNRGRRLRATDSGDLLVSCVLLQDLRRGGVVREHLIGLEIKSAG